MTDIIEAFIYDSVVELDAICQTIEAKCYPGIAAAKEVSEAEKKVFLAGRGELLKVAILQVSRIWNLFALDYALKARLSWLPVIDG